jgi:hypothetical protein
MARAIVAIAAPKTNSQIKSMLVVLCSYASDFEGAMDSRRAGRVEPPGASGLPIDCCTSSERADPEGATTHAEADSVAAAP